MINIQQALYRVMHSRYGREVRESIHDAIYQINENANEALQNAKAMGVGNDVTSATSSSTGYVAGNLYLNSTTWDLWQCIGTDSWVNKGNIQGAQGAAGINGTNYYIYIRYSQYYDGTSFTVAPTAASQYIGVYYGTLDTAPTNKADYQWASFVGASGTSAYVHIMYSEFADGTNFMAIPTATCKYIGFYSGNSASAPANKSYYTWSEYVGKSGTGTGDMLKADYDTDNNGAVDRADRVGSADTTVLEGLTDVGGQLNYKGSPIGSDYINSVSTDFDVTSKKLSLASSVTAKIQNLDNNGKIDYSNVNNTPTIPETDEWHKVGGVIQTVTESSSTGNKNISFTGVNTSLAYKLFSETSDGSQVGIKSSSLSGTTLTFEVEVTTLPTTFKLRVIK